MEGELVSGVNTLLGGVVQVYHRLHVGEGESSRRDRTRDHVYGDDVNDANLLSLSHGACVCG